MESQKPKMIGEVIETLIRVKDKLYGQLTFEECEALNDACNLLEKNLGELTRYDYTCDVADSERVWRG